MGSGVDAAGNRYAVAAALLRPLSNIVPEVLHNFGGAGAASNAAQGSSGTYGMYVEAYRRAAEARGVLTRQMQSITWEAVRGLFTADFKSQQKNVDAIQAFWENHQKGRTSLDNTRQLILDAAGGIESPAWYGHDSGSVAGPRAGDAPIVPGVQLSGRSARSNAGRAGSATAETAAAIQHPRSRKRWRVASAGQSTAKSYAKVDPYINPLAKLRDSYGAIEPWWKSEFGYGIDGLTESEARYILKSGLSADTLRDRLAATRDAVRPAGAAAAPGTAQSNPDGLSQNGNVHRSSIRDRLDQAIGQPRLSIVGKTSRTHTPEQLAAMRRVDFQVETPSLKERAKALTACLGKRLAQGLFDQFAPIRDLDRDAYRLTRLSKKGSLGRLRGLPEGTLFQ